LTDHAHTAEMPPAGGSVPVAIPTYRSCGAARFADSLLQNPAESRHNGCIGMNFNERQIPPPKYWQQFEDLCLSIFRNVWQDPTAQKNGRSGQQQHGTDVWGKAIYAGGLYHGVQCKGKDIGLGAAVTQNELLAEVAKAKNFTPKLSHWILATTAPKDAAIEALARQIAHEHEAQGLFAVQVLGWDDLQSLVAKYPDVIAEFYPEQAPLAKVSRDLGTIISEAKGAATADLGNFNRVNSGTSRVILGLERERDGQRRAISHLEVGSALGSGQSLMLEAEPGAGKSTTLRQLAVSIIADNGDLLPVLVPLPEVGLSRRELLDELASRESFRPIGRDGLAEIARAGRLGVLCDGWNEVPGDQRRGVTLQIDKFRRNYPDCGLLIATRSFSPHPLHGATRLRLLAPTPAQQFGILKERLGEGASDLLTRARRTRGLRDLLRTPLYVGFLADVGGNGNLPETKDEVIERFIATHEARPEHRDVLREDLQNTHRQYLRELAQHLTCESAVTISQAEMRKIISGTAQKLMDVGQIIDALVSHHVVIERAHSGDESLYAFQHQQFQEWFASFFVQECMTAAWENSPVNQKSLALIFNYENWTESTIFAVERLSRSPGDGPQIVGDAIIRTLGIDPRLAAAMIRTATMETWKLISGRIEQFVARWAADGDFNRAFHFMIMTGRSEFAERVWDGITTKGLLENRSAPAWFPPSVLGANGHARYFALPEAMRRALLWELTLNGGQEGIEFAIEVCRKEESVEVVSTVLEILEDRGTESEFEDLWQHARPEVWTRLATRHPLSYSAGDFRRKLVAEKTALGIKSSGAQRLQLLLELSEAGEYDSPEEVVALALETPLDNYHAEQTIFSRLQKLFPRQLSHAIIQQLIDGKALRRNPSSFVRVGKPHQQEALRAIAIGAEAREGRAKESAARALDVDSASLLIADLLATTDQLRECEEVRNPELVQRHEAISGALNMVSQYVLFSSLVSTHVEKARHISDLAELLFRWRSDRYDEDLSIDAATEERLCQVIEEWVEHIVADAEARGWERSNVASAIKRIPHPRLLPYLKVLLDADLAAWRKDEAEFQRLRQQGKLVRRSYVTSTDIYRQAFEPFQGEAVRDLLLQYIGTPEFEVEASFLLRRYGAAKKIVGADQGLGDPRYEAIPQARIERQRSNRPTSAVAAAVLDRIDVLVSTGTKDDLDRAMRMALAAAQMDYGDRFSTIRSTLSAPGPMSGRFELIQTLLFVGVPPRAAEVRQGFEEALAKQAKQGWWAQNDWWSIGRWLELLAFTDAPESILGAVTKLPPEIRWAHNFDRVVTAVGYTDAGSGLRTLVGLAEQVPGLETLYAYPAALVHIGSADAARLLVSLSFDSRHTAALGHDFFAVVNHFTAALRKHPEVKRDFLAQLGRAPDAISAIHSRVLSETAEPEDVLALLPCCDATDASGSLFSALQHSVYEMAIVDRPIEGTNAYERQPADLSDLRAKLFKLYSERHSHAGLAASLLGTIDRLRDEYGRSPSEPHHPDIESGIPWPPAAVRVDDPL
jgi:hypothetical protein